MDIQNLMSQMMKSNNPMQMMLGLLTPGQRQTVSQFQSQSREDQAKKIAEYCNRNGITKEQLTTIIGMTKS